jgi:hypothetical protein
MFDLVEEAFDQVARPIQIRAEAKSGLCDFVSAKCLPMLLAGGQAS